MNPNLDWMKNIKEDVFSFIEKMNVHKDYSFFNYSYSGDLFRPDQKWGLGQLVFATKILYMLDKIDDLIPDHKKNLIEAISSFQTQNGEFSDRLLFKSSGINRIKSLFMNKKLSKTQAETVRAESRQSFAALIALKEKPKYRFSNIPSSEFEIENYLSKLDWTNPWGAGSHFSHLIFFLHFNRILFEEEDSRADRLIQYAIRWINNFQSHDDGCWYKNNPSDLIKINGAMKILSGLTLIKTSSFSYHEKIIDKALTIAENSDACNDFNVVMTLSECSKQSQYRKDDIKKFCMKRLNQYSKYYFKDLGGFSFHLGKASNYYYGSNISRGLNEPDIHGTHLFLWGITLISKMVGLDLGLREPIT